MPENKFLRKSLGISFSKYSFNHAIEMGRYHLFEVVKIDTFDPEISAIYPRYFSKLFLSTVKDYSFLD